MLLSIAIPDSVFMDESTLRDKTVKTGSIARSCSIFGVERIYIYRDSSRNYERDYDTARTILQYAETPQYLRKALIPKNPDLEFAGLLPPLRIPHHQRISIPSESEIREGVLVNQNGVTMANIGTKELAWFSGKGQPGERVTVQIESLNPLKVRTVERPRDLYWGYEVRRAPSLARFLRSASFDIVILTSRKGKMIHEEWEDVKSRLRHAERVLICFGSPESGVDAMLKQDSAKSEDFPKACVLNTFPFQNTETVRLEEAILGTLAVLNIIRHL